ncbi:MAG: hypothetical protein GEV09_16780 [Pseudonocardiaceae bacterium]|nr:hypothetical protein [Pseudonocardiaceae bacterium]
MPAPSSSWIATSGEGDAATVLLEAAHDPELLVVGNGGRGALAGAVAGSVALRCVHHARCPVVLVPDPTASTSLERLSTPEPRLTTQAVGGVTPSPLDGFPTRDR